MTERGRDLITDFGIDLAALAKSKRPLCRSCLDWSARRNHLAGSLGSAYLNRFYELGWAKRVENSRIINFTHHGERQLVEMFRYDKSVHPTS